ncbi:hypothetical protein E4U25_007599 [Claviceps purpurea]|nr:hypothetical protein E4U25_007599 [Claviceps purpurea]
MEFNEENIEALLKDLTRRLSPSKTTLRRRTPSPLELDCDLLQKEVNLEDIEKMKVEDEDSLGQPALLQEQAFASRLQRRRLARRVAAPGTN